MRAKGIPRWVQLSMAAMLICVAGLTMAVVMVTPTSSTEFDRLSRLAQKEARQAEIRLVEIRIAQLRQEVDRPGHRRAECWGPRAYFAQTKISQTKICSGKRHQDAWLIYSPRD